MVRKKKITVCDDDTTSLSKLKNRFRRQEEARLSATQLYLRDICRESLLSKEEEFKLAEIIHNGTPDERERARRKLIEANLRLVVKIAHGFKNSQVPLRDLISAGNVGLIHSVEKFDSSKEVRFASYAVWWIKQAIIRAVNIQSRTIHIPVQSAAKLKKIKAARQTLARKLHREPTNREIADHLDFSENTVANLRMADLHFFSLCDQIKNDEEGRYQDIIADHNAIMPDEALGEIDSIDQLEELMAKLTERERDILIMRYGLDDNCPKSLEEIARKINRTRERVRQIQRKALHKIRKLIEQQNRGSR